MSTPNIVYILADDLGYGDVRANNAESKIPTPHLDRLASAGMRFTDAHAGSSVCTPSRYNILTGRYAWRTRLQQGVLRAWDGALIEVDTSTVADLLRDNGYKTMCLGKWHLGWEWPTHDGRHPNDTLEYGVHGGDSGQSARVDYSTNIDFTRSIAGGPLDQGFDTYYGIDVPNFPPYAWFEDDRIVDHPSTAKPVEMFGTPGPMVPGWSLEAVIPELARRAVLAIEDAAASAEPFFLYLPLTSPHSPIAPNREFLGRSGIGAYGDFVCEMDWVVGQVMDALDRTGLGESTIVVFTSDNGPEDESAEDEGAYLRTASSGHFSMGELRGIKRDAWEGGHRVPLLISWPGQIPEGSRCDEIVSLGDFYATCADVIGRTVGPGQAEDSVSMLPLLRGGNEPIRDCVIHHSMSGKFAIRRGNWVFIDAPSGDDNHEPEEFRALRGVTEHDETVELFDLEADLSQRTNEFASHAELAREMAEILNEVRVNPARQRADHEGARASAGS
jgi:arylsulfatase A